MMRATAIVVFAMGLVTGCDAGEGTVFVGREGGVVTSPDGRVTLEIPAGALKSRVDVSIDELDTEMPAGAVGLAYAIEPAGVPLLRPATLTFDLSDDEARGLGPAEAGLAVEDLALHTEKGGAWDRLPDREADPERRTVSGSVLFFDGYVVAPR